MERIEKQEIEKRLSEIPNWTFEDNFLRRSFRFDNFKEAFSFMTAVAFEAEHLNHHPNWDNVYNVVNIALQTHDVQGISNLDFDLAQRLNKLYIKFEN